MASIEIPPVVWVGLLVAAFGIAQFQAWDEMRADAAELRAQRDTATAIVLEDVQAAPAMPTSMTGYRPSGEVEHQLVRVFDCDHGSVLTDFPATMNGGDQRRWSVTWRTLGLPVRVGMGRYDHLSVHPRFDEGSTDLWEVSEPAKSGSLHGYSTCQPVFLLAPLPGETANLTDVAVDIQWWDAAP